MLVGPIIMFAPDIIARLALVAPNKSLNFAVKFNLQMQFNNMLRDGFCNEIKLRSKDVYLLQSLFTNKNPDRVSINQIIKILKKVVGASEPRIVLERLLISLKPIDEKSCINSVSFLMTGLLCTGQLFEYLVCCNLDDQSFSVDEVNHELF